MTNEIIDMHIHFGAPSDPKDPNGCYWSKEFEDTITYFALRVITRNLFGDVTIDKIKSQMIKIVNDSKYVKKGLFLALDQVYDPNGTPRKDLTHLHTSNKYLANLAAQNPRILFGASVNPYRKDWEAELDFCIQKNAMLCKWLPSAQNIDPSNSAFIPFYKKLAKHNLPLLCHTGPEYSIPPFEQARQLLNHPKLLRNALDNGVTVIAAHVALPLFPIDNTDDLKELIALFKEADKKKWNLYADISAMLFVNRSAVYQVYRKEIPQDRLIMGSDYPIPMSEFTVTRSSSLMKRLQILTQSIFMQNLLDKNYTLLKEMGFTPEVLSRASVLFSKINRT
ncbi:MAG: amidohydrolase family protein [Candidatus Omnitrophota bacterium]